MRASNPLIHVANQAKEIQEIRAAVDRIEACLTDDATMGRIGLVSRVGNHNQRIKRLERIVLYVAGAAGGVIVIYHVVVDLLVKSH